jgi:uncharacterized protein (TIGR03086 family)
MDVASNCEPWSVRRLASQALNNQLFWAGLVTEKALVSIEDTMGATPIEGDLKPVADDVVERTMELWRTSDVLARIHGTPAGDLPGSVVILFATIDAFAHAWDLSASVGRRYEFPGEMLPTIAAIIEATADGARGLGLIQPPTHPPDDATESERLMALIGRAITR